MDLKEELKQELLSMGVIDVDEKDSTRADLQGYPFSNMEGWPQVFERKDDYEDYKINPEPYECEPGLSFEEFLDEFHGDREGADEEENLDTENFDIEDFEVFDDKIVIKADSGGDWQTPHVVEITYFGSGKYEIKDLGICAVCEEGSKDTKDFLHFFGYKDSWEK